MIVKIQHRRGAYADYDPTKVLPGEIVVVQSDDPDSDDGKAIYIGTSGGTVKRLVTESNLETEVANQIAMIVAGDIDGVAQRVIESIEDDIQESHDNAILSKSYAVGDTGTRFGEDTDNSKYYKEQSASSASDASSYATNAQNAQQAIENMTASASGLPYGSTPTVTKTSVGGVVNLAFGIPVGGKGDSGEVPVVEITQSAYDALPESEKTRSDILYVIPDGPSGALAEDVYYDNTESGIAETDVQSVLDNLVISLADLQAILGNYGTIQTSTTASRAYKVGERIILGGRLYKATADISQGDTLAVGTNISQTTVGEEDANKTLWFTGETVSAQSSAGSIISISDSRITPDHILACDHISYGNPSYVSGTPSWSTAAGSFTVTGVCSAQTTATFVLIKKDN